MAQKQDLTKKATVKIISFWKHSKSFRFPNSVIDIYFLLIGIVFSIIIS